MVYIAYTENKRKYKAAPYSRTSIFLFVICVFTFVLPFIMTFASKDLWVKYKTYREQPIATYKHKYILMLDTSSSNVDKRQHSIICSGNNDAVKSQMKRLSRMKTSSFPSLDPDRCSLITVSELDNDYDGINEQINFKLSVSNISGLTINSALLVLFFDYKLHKECLLQLETVAIISDNFNLADSTSISELDVDIWLHLIQEKPINCYERKHHGLNPDNYNENNRNKNQVNDDEEDGNDDNSSRDFIFPYNSQSIKNMVNGYQKRRIRTTAIDMFKNWSNGRSKNEPFVISVKVHFIESTVIYKTTFWQMMKWAWMQYFSVLVLFIFISRKIKRFMFRNRILHVAYTQ